MSTEERQRQAQTHWRAAAKYGHADSHLLYQSTGKARIVMQCIMVTPSIG
jgi:hypothetical protein